jgi:hypothetical protein
MARTFVRQDAQIRQSVTYDDTITPSEANFETSPANIEEDLNNIRSMLSHLKDQQAGNWWDVLATPATFTGEGETQRGVDDLNADLHSLERKRVLVSVTTTADIAVPASQNYVVLGAGQLPPNTTAAVGVVTTLGTVVAESTSFGTHTLDEVAGSTAVSPKNLVEVFDAATRDEILSSGRKIWGLLQSEDGTDGHTITDSTTTRVQISFVRLNAAADDLEACPVSDIESTSINYSLTERKALDDLNEQDFLRGAVVDVPSSSTVTRQVAYDNQGTTPVDLTANAILDLEGAGLEWQVRDDLQAILFRIIEGSAGGTSEVELSSNVDVFDVDAVDVDFANGISVRTGGTRPIDVGQTDGVIETTAGDLRLIGAAELLLDDGNQAGSTWAQTTGIKLSDTTAEWDLFETNFGEVSLLSGINQAFAGGVRTKVQAVVTAAISANTDVNGPGTAHNNVDVDLAPYDSVVFVDDVEVYVNGILQRNGANAAANEDVYPGGTPSEGDLAFEYDLIDSPADVITVIVNGQ